MSELGQHPLIAIRFTKADLDREPPERFWYHLPRLGDRVDLDIRPVESGEPEFFSGKVVSVDWDEFDRFVYVRLE